MSGMTCLLIAEGCVVAIALVGMARLRRIQDENWQRHRVLLSLRPITNAFSDMKATIGLALLPAVHDMTTAMERFARAMAAVDESEKR